MSWTRRRFLLATSLATSAAAVGAPSLAETSATAALPHDEPAWLVGDPYLATTHDVGLGARSFAEAREAAFRFRTPDIERDRHALGVDPSRA